VSRYKTSNKPQAVRANTSNAKTQSRKGISDQENSFYQETATVLPTGRAGG
jgi:hypothetical protein